MAPPHPTPRLNDSADTDVPTSPEELVVPSSPANDVLTSTSAIPTSSTSGFQPSNARDSGGPQLNSSTSLQSELHSEIWGTTVNLQQTGLQFQKFLLHFSPDPADSNAQESKYITMLKEVELRWICKGHASLFHVSDDLLL